MADRCKTKRSNENFNVNTTRKPGPLSSFGNRPFCPGNLNDRFDSHPNSLWDISKNARLKQLEIIDFSKLNEIRDLSKAQQIEVLKLEGGIEKKLNIRTLKPLFVLTNLQYLRLANLKVEDDTLQPLAELKNLNELWLSNQFETKEFAWLATRLPNTKCNMFQAISKVNITGLNQELVWDTMVTGRKKPFLLSTRDQSKIDKYTNDFEKLKTRLA